MNGLGRVRRLLILHHPDDADELLELMRRDLGESVVHLSDEDLEQEADYFSRWVSDA